jgi:DNA repair protein RAD7
VQTVTTRARRRQACDKADEGKKEDDGESPKGKWQAKKGKKVKRRRLGVDPDGTSDEELTQAHFSSAKQMKRAPGQIDNCVECGVRFTVTPYTNAAPEESYPGGGLLCAKCAKNSIGSKGLSGRKTVGREKRRQVQSNLLNGHRQRGPKSLLQLCIEVSTFSVFKG